MIAVKATYTGENVEERKLDGWDWLSKVVSTSCVTCHVHEQMVCINQSNRLRYNWELLDVNIIRTTCAAHQPAVAPN